MKHELICFKLLPTIFEPNEEKGENEMKSLEKILVATDFTDSSASAVEAAITLATKFNTFLSVLTVIPDIKDSPIPLDKIKESIHRLLMDIEAESKKRGVVNLESKAVIGSPFDRIIEEANIQNANLIMLGSGDKENKSAYTLGITAEKVMRKASKPVWVVKKGSRHTIENILCAVDFSDASNRALQNAIFLSKAFNAGLTILTVIESLSNIYPGRPIVEPQTQGIYVKDRENEFRKFLGGFDLSGVRWEKLIQRGSPDAEILGAVRERTPDLLIMGSEGKTGISRILMGSVAEKVVRELPCSVITFKSEA